MAADPPSAAAAVTPSHSHSRDLSSSTVKHVPSHGHAKAPSADSSSSSHARHPSLPSPTLTNPDMILPDAAPIAPSPTLSYQAETPPSPETYMKTLRARDVAQMMALDQIQEAALSMAENRSGAASSRTMSPANGYEAHRLSSVEESSEDMTPRNSMALNALASSPTWQETNSYAGPPRPELERKMSDTSSVHTEDLENLMWSRYEASKGRGQDAMHQQMGDLGSPQPSPGIDHDRESEAWSDDEVDQEGADIVSSALSKRAEMILANAKERLLLMEGNLRGARHSLLVSPSLSLRALKSSSELSNQVAVAKARDKQLYRGLGGAPKPTLHTSPGKNGNSPGHTRVFSETLIHSSPTTSMSRPGSQRGMRSSSALGSLGGVDDHHDHINIASNGMAVRASRSHDYIRPINQNNTSTPDAGNLRKATDSKPAYGLDPLPENEPSPSAARHSRLNRSPPSIKEHVSTDSPKDSPQQQSPMGPYDRSHRPSLSPSVSPRPASTASDLKDQMNHLKGRISSLREKAKEDSLRRRSLQSMRTPSPFTAAESWYYGADGYKHSGFTQDAGVGETRSPIEELPAGLAAGLGQANAPLLRSKESTTTFQMSEAWDLESRYEDAVPQHETSSDGKDGPAVQPDSELEDRTLHPSEDLDDDGDDEGVDEEDDEPMLASSPKSSSSSGAGSAEAESIYEEASQELPGLRHEDRPDAFDYQHFFLHSSMGTYQTSSGSGTDDSASDADSVETATPVNAVDDDDFTARGQGRPGHLGPSPTIVENWQRPPTSQSISSSGARSIKSNPSYVKAHSRTMSSDTVSSVATFATATEGRRTAMGRSDYEESDPEDDTTLNQAMGFSTPVPQTPPVPTPKPKRKPSGSSLPAIEAQPKPESTFANHSTQTSISSIDHDNIELAIRNGAKSHASQNSGSSHSVTPVATPTDESPALSLLKMATQSRSSESSSGNSPNADLLEGLTDKDCALILSLADTIVNACEELRGEKGQRYDARVWRRRMDGARRLLQKGVDGSLGRERSVSRTRGQTPDVMRDVIREGVAE